MLSFFREEMYFMTISAVAAIITLMQVFFIVSRVFAVLYIVFVCKHYNENINVGLCVLAVFFPLISVIVQLSRKKHMQGEGLKVCRQCGEKLPPNYQVCPRCMAPLEQYDEAKAKKSKTLSHVMLAVFSVSKATVIISMIVFLASISGLVFTTLAETVDFQQRVSITVDGEEVYFDKKGKSYDDPDDVVLYAKDGTKYVYDDDTGCYVNKNTDEYDGLLCYVDRDGWFYYDAEDTLSYVEPDMDRSAIFNLGEDELKNMKVSDLVSRILDLGRTETWCDEDGNEYYSAFSASWNEKGELIWQENAG